MMWVWAFVYEGVQRWGGVGVSVGCVMGVVAVVVGVVLRLGLGVGVGVRDGLAMVEDRRRRRKREFLIGVRLLSGVRPIGLKALWRRAWGVDDLRMRAGWGIMGILGVVRSVGVSGSGEVGGRGELAMLVIGLRLLLCENSVVVLVLFSAFCVRRGSSVL